MHAGDAGQPVGRAGAGLGVLVEQLAVFPRVVPAPIGFGAEGERDPVGAAEAGLEVGGPDAPANQQLEVGQGGGAGLFVAFLELAFKVGKAGDQL